MKKIGHGKIPLTDYHMVGSHPLSLRVDIYLDKKGEIKLFYAPTSESNFIVTDFTFQKIGCLCWDCEWGCCLSITVKNCEECEEKGESVINYDDVDPKEICSEFTPKKDSNEGRNITMNKLKIWQERQKRMDEWFIKPENEGATMEECPLISGYKYLGGDRVYNITKFKCTWVETGETVILEVGQVGQGIPYYKALKVIEVIRLE